MTWGAERLVDGVTDSALSSGVFYASQANKLKGPLVNQAAFLPDLANAAFQDNAKRGHPPLHFMTTARPGDTFDLDVAGTVITGRYVEVDRPHRLIMEWQRQGADDATPTPALREITLTPAGDRTTLKVEGFRCRCGGCHLLSATLGASP